jgi:hypothetical protein
MITRAQFSMRRELGRLFGIAMVKDYLSDLAVWIGAACSMLLVLYFLASPVIFQNTSGRTASPLLLRLNGPVMYVLESDFKEPMLWYFGLWGIGIEYFASEPVPKPPWYVTPTYMLLGFMVLITLGCPLWKRRLKKSRLSRRTNGLSQRGVRFDAERWKSSTMKSSGAFPR